MPNLRSNIPRKPAYGIFVGELFRICKSSSSSLHFKEDVKSLCDKLIKQLYVKKILMKELKRFISYKPACLSRFWSEFKVVEFF